MLVSGVVNICDDSGEVITKRGVTADADVLIKTEMIYSDELSEKYEIKYLQENKGECSNKGR